MDQNHIEQIAYWAIQYLNCMQEINDFKEFLEDNEIGLQISDDDLKYFDAPDTTK